MRKYFIILLHILKDDSFYASKFFYGINFNPAFYSIGDEAVTFKFIDANYFTFY